ncbi:uncharacterized protein PV06_02117 [Exophiala oligosperma]|uniref:DNA replication regulator Sld3 C-terminal domain-containing protein n=1 Tax=Exophiala oligosperma TaxID=215243 RepID=A0A0D2DV53_9EURO|nr:uncharacterized protein PV06_02117 [Exophiala oligosperma]KIW46445.1 hypothetical protein PV06_02117 [Exophiala oligosperma]
MQSPSTSERSALVSVTSSSLNAKSNSLRYTKKRKYSDLESREAHTEILTATVLPARSQSWDLERVTLLARAFLPLSWLDTSQPATVIVFETTTSFVQKWNQGALIARGKPNDGLYAIERAGSEHFVALALQNWVSEEYCKDAALGNVAEIRLENLLGKDNVAQQTHRRSASGSSFTALPTPKSPRRPTNRRGALARMSILTQKDTKIPESVFQSSSSPTFIQQPVSAPCASSSDAALPITPAARPETVNPFEQSEGAAEDVSISQQAQLLPHAVTVENPCASERLRGQYLEHLYTSKTSLAFYVKGPLSRARAHVRSSDNPSTLISELLEFYGQAILPAKKIDTKYKESLPKVLEELPLEDTEPSKKKSRKKKTKLGKDCLWPEEDDYVGRWWRSRDLRSISSSSDRQTEIRRELADLRMRETKMQLLLILEYMLLEMAASKLSEKPAHTDPDVKVESVEDDGPSILAKTPQKFSKKKKRDIVSELDTIVERLCIWHSVNLSEGTESETAPKDHAPQPGDSLREFCKDVLWPFYSAKLPDQMKAVSRKLSGLEPSPKRPTQTSKGSHKTTAPASLPKSRPGEPLVKRTLQRVLSEDHLGRHASPPTLSRSSTGPTKPSIPTLKREPSERPMSRGGMLSKSVSFSNREIDLVADSKIHDAKRRKLDKLAQQKQELEAAIDALKRPSRSAVAAAFMDEVEKRQQEKTVQISATPRARRTRDQGDFFLEPELPPMPTQVRQEETSVIPSSTRKPLATAPGGGIRPGSSGSVVRSSGTKRAVLSAIHETPSRAKERKRSDPSVLSRICDDFFDQDDDDDERERDEEAMGVAVLSRSARPSANCYDGTSDPPMIEPRSDLGMSSSQMSSSRRDELRMTRSQRPVLFTPLRKSDVRIEHAFRDAPEIPRQAGLMMNRVMGGHGRALDFGFVGQQEGVEHVAGNSSPIWSRDAEKQKEEATTVRRVAENEDEDIYDQLGWNDDFDL